jgi:hypothetical protein
VNAGIPYLNKIVESRSLEKHLSNIKIKLEKRLLRLRPKILDLTASLQGSQGRVAVSA